MSEQQVGQAQQETPELYEAVMDGLLECHEWGYLTIPSYSIINSTNDRVVVAREFVLAGRDQPDEPVDRLDAFSAESGIPRGIIKYLGIMSSGQAMREAISLRSGIPAAGLL